jgi:hypothetical protein
MKFDDLGDETYRGSIAGGWEECGGRNQWGCMPRYSWWVRQSWPLNQTRLNAVQLSNSGFPTLGLNYFLEVMR